MLTRFSLSKNANSPIVVTPSGIVMPVESSRPLNALSPIEITPSDFYSQRQITFVVDYNPRTKSTAVYTFFAAVYGSYVPDYYSISYPLRDKHS